METVVVESVSVSRARATCLSHVGTPVTCWSSDISVAALNSAMLASLVRKSVEAKEHCATEPQPLTNTGYLHTMFETSGN